MRSPPGSRLRIAAFGAALGQGRVGAAAMESIGRNPNAAEKLFLPLVLTLALLEALALYGFVIAILLQGKSNGSLVSMNKRARRYSSPFFNFPAAQLVEVHLGVTQQLLQRMQLIRLLIEDVFEAGIHQNLEAVNAGRVGNVNRAVFDA